MMEIPLNEDSNEFKPATSLNRHQRRLARSSKHIPIRCSPIVSSSNTDMSFNDLECVLEILYDRVQKAMNVVMKYFEDFNYVLDRALDDSKLIIEEIVCLGLGSFSLSKCSRDQLAFLILLQKKLSAEVIIYDPIFNHEEVLFLTNKLGFKLESKKYCTNEIMKIEQCKHKVTLFFLPHFPHEVLNNLLYVNWFPSVITKCLFLSSTFRNFECIYPKSRFKEHFQYIYRYSSAAIKYNVPNSFCDKTVFNDMDLYIFPQDKPKCYEDEYWIRTDLVNII